LYLGELRQEPQYTLPHLDGEYHDQAARDLANVKPAEASRFSAIEYGRAPYLRPPGYIYFLATVYALLGSDYTTPRLVQFALARLYPFGVENDYFRGGDMSFTQ
jgi:hypothetical protein